MKVGVVGAGAMGCFLCSRVGVGLNNIPQVLFRRTKPGFSPAQTIRQIQVDEIDHGSPKSTVVQARVADDWARVDTAFDVLVVSVKFKDTKDVARDLVSSGVKFNHDAALVSLQNGIGNVELLEQEIRRHGKYDDVEVLHAVTYTGVTKVRDFHVKHAGDGLTYIQNPSKDETRGKIQSFADLLSNSGMETKVAENIFPIVYTKLLVNSVINPLTALLNMPNGGVVECVPTVKSAVEEFVEISNSLGVELDTHGKDPVQFVLDVARATENNISSMLADIRAGNETEIEAINAGVVRLAEAHGLAVPKTHKLLYELVSVLERRKKG